jgi:pilus assembly protein CpaE
MRLSLTCIVADPSDADREEMVRFLHEQGVEVVAQASALAQVQRYLAQPDAAQVVIVNLDPNTAESLAQVGAMIRQFGGVSFLVMSRSRDPDLLMEAIHVGVREFVALPVNEDRFRRALERLGDAQTNGSKRGRIVQVVPTSGGCGSTTIACNLAAAMATGGKTVIVDLDLVSGTVATSFDVRPRFTVSDLMDVNQKLDRQLLDNALTLHEPSGVAILARPELPEDAHRVTATGMQRLLQVLGRSFDYVVLDSQMGVEGVYPTASRAADINVVVLQLNVPSVRNAQRFVSALRRMGVEAERIRLVANRFVKRGSEVQLQEAERVLGMSIAWTVPNDYRTAVECLNYGEPAVLRYPRTEVSGSLSRLAGVLNGRTNH